MKISRFRIPQKINLLGTVISIKELPDTEITEDANWEYLVDSIAVIRIKKSLPIRRKRYLLLHELQHALLDMMHTCLDNRPDLVAIS